MNIVIANQPYEITYTEDPTEISKALANAGASVKWITYDTETTGLHVKKDRPFLGAICWDGVVYVFPTTAQILMHLEDWTSMVEYIFAHNTVFDMCMSANIIGDKAIMRVKNWADTMCLARLTFEAVSTRDGGDSLKLKAIGKKYIDPSSDRYEKAVKGWLKAKEVQDRKLLIAMLRSVGGTMKQLEAGLSLKEQIPMEMLEIYNEWQAEYPKPTYQDVPMEIMLPYVAVDVILTNLLVHKAMPVVTNKKQLDVMKEEFDLIPIIFDMTRTGIKVDREYLMESLERLENYIADEYQALYKLNGGIELSVNKRGWIIDYYTDEMGEKPKSVDKKFLANQKAEGDLVAEYITRLRTLEKWKSTYIERILEGSEYDGRFYASLDQFNPISGRFSGNMHQQPKKSIKHHATGEDLFHPRRAFVTDQDSAMFLIDFSQVELRTQAHYTLPFGGDLNLCRAYMPFKCIHFETHEKFDHTTEAGLGRWNERLSFDDASAWMVPETGEPWKPTDVHSASTRKALNLMGIDPDSLDHKEFQTWRGLGKGVNFAKNYGVGIKGAAEQFGLTLDVAKALCEGYNAAFPVVIDYQNAIVKALTKKGFVVGIYGRRYYLNEPRRFYRAANYIIQGSCAHDLKRKMFKIYNLLQDYRSKMLLCIHDEIIFIIHKDEYHLVPIIKEIMEYTPSLHVPIVAEVDYTTTNWADKEPYQLASVT